jgi:hAT family C-terminal dimerisation region
LVDVAKDIDVVGQMFGLLEAIYAFQAVSTIRNAVFIAAQEIIYVDERVLKMPQQSDTRWVCKYVGVQYFQKRFASVVKALDDLSQSSNKKEAAEARGLLLQFQSFDMVFFLNVFEFVLGITNGLSLSLQRVSLDFGACQRLLDSVSQTLRAKRTDEAFDAMWMQVKTCASANGIPICESAKRPVRLASTLASSVVMSGIGQGRNRETSSNLEICTQFRLKYFEIIDTVTEEMKRRFTESDVVLNALCAFSPHSPSLFSDELLDCLAEKYQTLLNVNKELLHSQIIVAKNMFQQTPDSTMEMYKQLSTMHCAFPDLLVLFKLALTVPVASASAERSFSAMRRIKSHLRASMSEMRTSDLSLISVEREVSDSIMKNPSSVIDAFAGLGKRRLTLV